MADATLMTPEEKVISTTEWATGLGVRFSIIVLDRNNRMVDAASDVDYKLTDIENGEITTLVKQIIGIINSARDRADRDLS